MEGSYSGKLMLTTIRNDIPYTNQFDSNVTVEFKGNKKILVESFYTEPISYNSSERSFTKEEGDGVYHGYFKGDSLFMDFKAKKSGTTYFYTLKKNL